MQSPYESPTTGTESPRLVVVLGMHRGGTSAITRALPALGVGLGDRLLAPAPNNPTGFFEDEDFKSLSEELLDCLGHDWHTLLPITAEEQRSSVARRFAPRAAALVRARLDSTPAFGVKDPRMTRLLVFWRDAFAAAGVGEHFVIAYRNPLSVARSLAARDGFVPEKSHRLWIEHMANSLQLTGDRPRLVVDYDRMMESPEAELRRLGKFLGTDVTPAHPSYAEYVNQFLDQGLRHARFTAEHMNEGAGLPPLARDMAAAFEDLAADRKNFDAAAVLALEPRLAAWATEERPTLALMRVCDDGALELAWRVRERDARIAQLEASMATRRPAQFVPVGPAGQPDAQARSGAATIAIVVHAYHLAPFQEIIAALKSLDPSMYRLYITCPGERLDPVHGAIEDAGLAAAVMLAPNRGRDMLPFLQILPAVAAAGHKLVLKLHGKQSSHRVDGEAWRRDLVGKLVGEQALDRALAHFRTDPAVGLLAAAGHLTPMATYWGSNAARVIELAKRTGLGEGAVAALAFPAGSMFYARLAALFPLLALGLDARDFEDECGQTDGTMAHAVERMVGVSVAAAMYRSAELGADGAAAREYSHATATARDGSPLAAGTVVAHRSLDAEADYVPHTPVPPPLPSPIKLVCFYLPQYHAIPENDRWWGPGFTEWNHVRAARPRFAGHYQPHEPDALGYYDLLDPATLPLQIARARHYGISAFCFYFYWFGGRRPLEAPLARFLADDTLDIEFCLCWANENWTRRWDGLDNEILLAQRHSADDDIAFIAHVAPYLRDRRAMRIDGKPLLVVYRPAELPDAAATAQRWREWCRAEGIGEIVLAGTQAFDRENPAVHGFDAAVEFPPNDANAQRRDLTARAADDTRALGGVVYDWNVLAERAADYTDPGYLQWHTICPGWDNAPRRRVGFTTYVNNTPARYRAWLDAAVRDTLSRHEQADRRLVFVNAWNEWSEGAHLEPDRRFGHAYLHATRDCLMGIAAETVAARELSWLDREARHAEDRNRPVATETDLAAEAARLSADRDAAEVLKTGLARANERAADRESRLAQGSALAIATQRHAVAEQSLRHAQQLANAEGRRRHALEKLLQNERLRLADLESKLAAQVGLTTAMISQAAASLSVAESESAALRRRIKELEGSLASQGMRIASLEQSITMQAALKEDSAVQSVISRISPMVAPGRFAAIGQWIDRIGGRLAAAAGDAAAAIRRRDLRPSIVPSHQLRVIAPSHYESLGNDPQFVVECPGGMPQGWCLLRLGGYMGNGAPLPAALYIDTGSGFGEAERIALTVPSETRPLDMWVLFPTGVRALRFDPTDKAGEFHVEKFELVCAGAIHRALWYLRPHLERLRRDPAWALNAVRTALRVLSESGWAGLKSQIVARASTGQNDYAQWIELYDTMVPMLRERHRLMLARLPSQPLISVIMPVFDPPPALLEAAIDSVQTQLYPHWELCIADDASRSGAIRALLRQRMAADARIKVVFRERNGHISAATNSALRLATGEFVTFLDQDDVLAEHALAWIARTVVEDDSLAMVYSDEDKIDAAGRRHDHYFKCDFNLPLLRSQNTVCHLAAYRRGLVEAVGGMREGLEGAQDHDLALRCIERITPAQIAHIPRVLYHWRVLAGSTALAGGEKPYAVSAGERAIREHLARSGVGASVAATPEGHYRVRYALPAPPPQVSIIVPTRNAADMVKRCVDSIRDRTSYANTEIILVDNGSDDVAARDYFSELEHAGQVRILRDDGPFNFSRLNNRAVDAARGEFVCLLNNDVEIINADWLDEMVSLALQPGTGAVGARLWYPDDSLQHGGIILGLGGVAGHSHKHLARGLHGYANRACLQQAVSAVTGACLLVRRAVYQDAGGLDEENLAIAFNDVDFCLRLRQSGLTNIWTPNAELYHHESASRGHEDTPEKKARFADEVGYMKKRWAGTLENDPYYSRNLTLDREDFSLAWPPRIPPT